MMSSETVRGFVESARLDIDESPQMGEATTKAAILRDFIELLGWEIPANTELEYSVKAFGRTYKVDYALLIEGRPVAFLEAKGLDTSLTDDHREQLSEYLRSEDVNWGILSNGREYEFYQRRVIDSKVVVESIEKTTLQNLPNKKRIIEAYQIEKIRDDESEMIIEWIRDLRESWTVLQDRKEDLAEGIIDSLTESMPEAIASKAEPEAKEMIDRLIDELESEINIDTSDTIDRDTQTELTDTTTTNPDQYRAVITGDVEMSKTFQDTVQADLMKSVVEYFIEEHNLVSAIRPLPYIPGKKRAIINDKPTYDGNEMAQPHELAQGYYIELNLSWSQKKREIERMADSCGLDVSIDSPKND